MCRHGSGLPGPVLGLPVLVRHGGAAVQAAKSEGQIGTLPFHKVLAILYLPALETKGLLCVPWC